MADAARTANSSTPLSLNSLGTLSSPFSLLKLAAVLACALSGLVLLFSLGSFWWLTIALLALALLLALLFLEGIFSVLARRYPKPIIRLTRPLSWLQGWHRARREPYERINEEKLQASTTSNSHSLAATIADNGPVMTEEEQSLLDARERLMIRSILRLDESTTREVMMPRVDVVAVEVETPLREVANTLVESGHSRLPVYRETIDRIEGVVHSLDLLPLLANGQESPPLQSILRPAFFIPESKRLDELLQEFQERRIQMAIVVDEYGGTEGLVTLEDLLEEIVGEIDDEFSRHHEPQVVPVGDGDLLVDARITLSYLSDLFSTTFEEADVDTVGGIVYASLGKIPKMGDEVNYGGLRIEVVSLVGRRIRRLRVTRVAKQD